MDDVYRLLRNALLNDAAIQQRTQDRIGIEGEQSLADLPAITYLLLSGPAEEVLERPPLKVDVWSAVDEPRHLQPIVDRIDAVLRDRKFVTDAGRRVIIDRDTTWADVPDPDARHRTSTWSVIVI